MALSRASLLATTCSAPSPPTRRSKAMAAASQLHNYDSRRAPKKNHLVPHCNGSAKTANPGPKNTTSAPGGERERTEMRPSLRPRARAQSWKNKEQESGVPRAAQPQLRLRTQPTRAFHQELPATPTRAQRSGDGWDRGLQRKKKWGRGVQGTMEGAGGGNCLC